jgi:hypothetical protein
MTDGKLYQTREERLAAQLRENLKRRKAQARAMSDPGPDDNGKNETESQETGLPKTAG